MRAPAAAANTDLEMLTDAEIAKLARERVEGAFRVIMRRHNRRLYRIARAVTADDNEAEDVVQEAYVLAFTHLDGFRGDSTLATWLSRIVLNEALGRIRRRRPGTDLTLLENGSQSLCDVVSFPLASPQLDPERTMAQREIRVILERAIDDLPEPFRIVLVARVIEDMSVEETAALLTLRAETVKTRLHRARRLLRDTIEKQIGPVLADAFPFAGARCARLTGAVLKRLAH